ncbi:CpsD/CapB family tyrosine-protein kinase [Desemzia sp. RIT804]|uniref:CpsD/CapB family tyrosine-protein kinase n=1 Tax=Desemzia sp. RIT 804 TaxID=2810209 RepID=UPI0019529EDC|nr:CpsD/CapB family tyrosine-protein kinase [Desemzia sp. RIT 804]MBM6615849.1 CpsD/CapB family tyrosine-protein kinase [Desemzia sp. RIT 804]
MFRQKKTQHNKEGNNLITLMKPSSVISEEFRTLRTNIQFSMVDKKFTTLMFTSASPGEGKTTVASNVAVVFASQGKKVLLVDADMRNPSVHQQFNLLNHKGLTNLLTEEKVNIQDIVQQTVVKDLFVLTCGIIPPNPSELLASNKMDQLMDKLTNYFDLILFDLPPILAVTDAQVMANKTDGTIFVIRNGVAEKNNLYKAKELLEHVHANVIGVVYNDKKRSSESAYHYYGVEN